MARYFLIAIVGAGLLTSCGFHKKKYDDPITKDTKQPDKVLFDRAIDDIEHSRYEIARITLNTLINTYDQSEFLAKAKLAVADSWFREGGAAGMAQAEAEYKDFILFYPTMEEAAESQQKICQIHYKQMDKVDRDQSQAIRAEDECRTLITQFPNSKYVDETKQLLRNIQESIAEGEYLVGAFYMKRGDNSAAANRLGHVVEQYPLYSKADLALWQMGQAYGNLGSRFRKQEGEAYSRIVRDYPLSEYADDAAGKLKKLELPVPEADKGAVARMQYEKEHRERLSAFGRGTQFLKRGPDMSTAAHQGDPAMTTLRPSIPPLVPLPAGAIPAANGDVTATPITDSTALDTKPDARDNAAGSGATPAVASTDPAQTSQSTTDQNGKKKKKSKKEKPQPPPTLPPLLNPRVLLQSEARRSEPLRSMSRILLADDSPHAQRMGERILREEGFEVVSLTDGDAAMLRLADVDPDLILADVFLPGKSGFDICRYVKNEPRFKHVRVVLTAGLLEPFDEEEAKRAGCDAILKKPFEASKVVSTIDPLVKEEQLARGLFADQITSAPAPVSEPVAPPEPLAPPAPEIDPERVRAAITLALDAALPAIIQEITERVLIALGH